MAAIRYFWCNRVAGNCCVVKSAVSSKFGGIASDVEKRPSVEYDSHCGEPVFFLGKPPDVSAVTGLPGRRAVD
jgi:hypothetical protein